MKFSPLLLAVWMIFGFTAPLQAQTATLAYVDFPPYEYIKDNRPAGVLVQIVQTIFQRANIPVELVFYPFRRAFEETKEGKITGLFNFYKTEERLKDFDYSDPILSNPLVLFVPKESALQFNGSLNDLKGKTIGAMLGYTYGTAFDNATTFSIDQATSHEINFNKLVSNRIDAYPCDKLVGLYVLDKEHLISKVKFLPIPLKVMEGHIGFTKNKHADILRKINKVIEDMKQNKEIEKIVDQYMKDLSLNAYSN